MTKPDIEAALSQLSLAQPSAEMEQRMSKLFTAACQESPIHQSVTSGCASAAGIRHQRQPWGLMSVVAIICLLLGMLAGPFVKGLPFPASADQQQLVGSKSNVEHENRNSGSHAGGAQDSRDGAGSVSNGSGDQQAEGDLFADSSPTVRPQFWTEVQGPSLTMLCGVRIGGAGAKLASGVEQCLQCHSGLSDAESRFLQTHMLNPRFATCAWCHDGSRISGLQ